MTVEEEAAKEAAAAAAEKGAKDGGAPTPEQLKAAQDKAEEFRKEAEEAKEQLEESKKELEKLEEKSKLSQAEKERKLKLELGISDDEALVAELEGLAAKGDATARAYLKKMEKIAEAIAENRQSTIELEKSAVLWLLGVVNWCRDNNKIPPPLASWARTILDALEEAKKLGEPKLEAVRKND